MNSTISGRSRSWTSPWVPVLAKRRVSCTTSRCISSATSQRKTVAPSSDISKASQGPAPHSVSWPPHQLRGCSHGMAPVRPRYEVRRIPGDRARLGGSHVDPASPCLGREGWPEKGPFPLHRGFGSYLDGIAQWLAGDWLARNKGEVVP